MAEIDVAPRRRMVGAVPGTPELPDISRPGAAPCSFSPSVAEATPSSVSELTDDTAPVRLLRFRV